MKNNAKGIISLLARFLPAYILVYAGFLKATSPIEEFAFAISAYKIFPSRLLLPIAFALPWFEIYLGIFLALGLFRKQIHIMVISLFTLFEVMLFSTVVRGISLASCGCFGTGRSNSITVEIIINLMSIALCAISLRFGAKYSLDELIEKSAGRGEGGATTKNKKRKGDNKS